MGQSADAVVVGGGMAGVSIAYELARSGQVVLIEAETSLAHHTTGRSAALYAPTYGNATVRALTAASLEDFGRIGRDLADAPLLEPREVIWVARPGETDQLEKLVDEVGTDALRPITSSQAVSIFPALRPEMTGAAAIESQTADIDVAGLHQAYVRGLRSRGGEIVRGQRVAALERSGSGWSVATPASETTAPLVVNAAGAWADAVAERAGLAPVGLRPLRRTLCACPVPTPAAGTERWPWLGDAGEHFYCRPEHTQVLVSPADATESEPCDAVADELDVARALETVNEWTTFSLRSVSAAWAGLRTFAPDKTPVVGWSGEAGGFFWMAGQGGYGIQMAPALARLAAAIALGEPLPAVGVTEAEVSPERFSAR